MITVAEYRGFWLGVQGLLGINKVFMVRTIEELQKKLRDQIGVDETVLAVVVPSSDTEGRNNFALFEKYTCVVYALRKVDIRNDDEQSMLDTMDLTENIAIKIKVELIIQATVCESDWHHIFKEMDVNQGIHTDPEWDVMGTGCEGYSVSFMLKSAF